MKEDVINQLKKVPLNNCYEGYFYSIAKNMFENYCIKKGEDIYYFTSLEFYFCHKNHFDMITYPRNTEAGQWFFHQSGVDLTFESHFSNLSKYNYKPIVSVKDDYAYGGILIKEVVKKGGKLELKGPCITMWELFDVINAFSVNVNNQNVIISKNWPVITESEGFPVRNLKSMKRVLRLDTDEAITKKFKSLNKYIFKNAIPQSEEDKFKETVLKKYCFEVPRDHYDHR